MARYVTGLLIAFYFCFHSSRERKLRGLLNAGLNVKEVVEKQLLICQRIYLKGRREILSAIFQAMVKVLGADCPELVLLKQWKLGLLSRRKRNCTLY